jgi:hypothetical protein
MTTGYVAACEHPGFDQTGPSGPGWERRAVGADGRTYFGAYIFANPETGAERVAPAIWYNSSPAEYAKGLRFNAERNDECAAYKDTEGKAWSAGEAEQNRRQARRLRAMAKLCDMSEALRAGEIDFRGLSDPMNPREAEARTVAAIEALEG